MQWISFCRKESGNELNTNLETKSIVQIGIIYELVVMSYEYHALMFRPDCIIYVLRFLSLLGTRAGLTSMNSRHDCFLLDVSVIYS